jgi:alkylation response protein AidB-like acyl-CoA dehydrogenase
VTDELTALAAAVRAAVTSRHPLDSGAAAVTAGSGSQGWSTLHDLGVTGLGICEGDGGSGGGLREQAVALAEAAAILLPAPYLATVAALPLLPSGSALRQQVAAGRARLTFAWAAGDRPAALMDLAEAPALFTPGTVTPTGAVTGAVTGTARLVLDLRDATDVLVLTPQGVAHVCTTAPGVSAEPRSTVDQTRSLDDLVLHAAPAELVLPATAVTAAVQQARRALRVGSAAEALGIAARCLELAVAHARTREAFGRPIGVHQAISHPLVEIYADVELTRSAVSWAAACCDADEERAEEAAASACLLATRTAVDAAERTIQVLGGVGFTWEHVVHRLYKRTLGLSQLAGSRGSNLEVVAMSLLGPA